jgi:tetratricopeptide (TPR) repeat protein
MKHIFILLLTLGMFATAQAQDPAKDIKKAARSLGSYNLDPVGMEDKLDEAIQLADASINDPVVAADPTSWLTYGEIFLAAVDKDARNTVLDTGAIVAYPEAPAKAYKGFMMTAQIADKSYQTKDAMKALAIGIQNIYYLGSVLYQDRNYKAAYEAFKATYDSYSLLKKHNEPTEFDPAEHPKALYYAGLCAQEAGMMKEATIVFEQLVNEGIAEPAVYEALVAVYSESNPTLSEKYLMEGRAKYPDYTALLYAEINHYLAKGELVGLIDKLEKALTLEPDNTSVIVTLGQIYDKLYQDNANTNPVVAEEHFTKAMEYYRQAKEKDPKNFDATYSIGALYYNKAAAYSVELNTLANDYSPAGNKKYADKEAQMNAAFNQALPFFEQAEKINPTDFNTLTALKEIYARQNKLDQVNIYKEKIDKLNK